MRRHVDPALLQEALRHLPSEAADELQELEEVLGKPVAAEGVRVLLSDQRASAFRLSPRTFDHGERACASFDRTSHTRSKRLGWSSDMANTATTSSRPVRTSPAVVQLHCS